MYICSTVARMYCSNNSMFIHASSREREQFNTIPFAVARARHSDDAREVNALTLARPGATHL